MWIFWFVLYMLAAATVFGYETYATKHIEYSPFYHWGETYEYNPAGFVSLLVAAFWPVCAPFYFAVIIAGTVPRRDKHKP